MKKYQVGILGVLLVTAAAAGSVAAFASTEQTENREKSAQFSTFRKASAKGIVLEPVEKRLERCQMNFFYSSGFTLNDLRDTGRFARISEYTDLRDPLLKEYVYDKMLNTCDFYETLSGQYRLTDEKLGVNTTVSYCIQSGEEAKSVEIVQNGEETAAQVAYYANNVVNRMIVQAYNPLAGTEEVVGQDRVESIDTSYLNRKEALQYDYVSMIKSNSRVQTDEAGIPIYYYRQSFDGMGQARQSISPQEMAFGYLSDFSRWNITAKTEVAGRVCYLVEGFIDGEYAKKLGAFQYKFYIDQETGILLRYENYNQAGGLTSKLETISIEVNASIPEETFYRYGGRYLDALCS